MTESWCHSDITNGFLSIDDYELVPDLRLDRGDTAQGRGGGLLVYVKNGLPVMKMDNTVDFQQYVNFKVKDVCFTLVYRSPNAPAAAMDGLIDLVKGAPKAAVMLGDFNLPDVTWNT
jgi:hypothetical protein